MKKMKTTNKVLIFLFAVLTVFTIAMIITFNRMNSVPDTLITCVFAACLGEFSVLGVIKTSKIKHGNDDDEQEDEDYE